MLIRKKASWYRPYYIVASGREYKLERIHFYKDNKILVSSNSGWLENSKSCDIDSIELPINEIKAKRKGNFNGEIFAISKGKESYGDDLLAELYIPADMFNIHFVEHVIKYNSQVIAIYKGDNDIYINTYVKSIDGELYSIREQYEEIYKECDGYRLQYHTREIIEKLDMLKAIAQQFVKTKEQVESLTIDDIEL